MTVLALSRLLRDIPLSQQKSANGQGPNQSNRNAPFWPFSDIMAWLETEAFVSASLQFRNMMCPEGQRGNRVSFTAKLVGSNHRKASQLLLRERN